MKLSWDKVAWEDYLYWQQNDKSILRKLNELIKECLRTPFDGKGKPETLKGSFANCWSRRISDEHRLVYQAKADEILILQCRFHYTKK